MPFLLEVSESFATVFLIGNHQERISYKSIQQIFTECLTDSDLNGPTETVSSNFLIALRKLTEPGELLI